MLSAPVGEGHVAAARALATRMRALWPEARVREVEHTGRGGPWRDALLKGSYAVTMRVAPRAYGFGYDLLVRQPRLAELFKELAAGRFGRALEPLLMAEQPDLVVSTYPMISGGLAWLRRHERLPAHTVAVVTDVAVHPFWVWPDLDETWTLLPASQEQARSVAPGADIRVVPAAVDPIFRPGDQAGARTATGLRADAFVVLVSGGSLGFGGIERLVDAVAAAGTDVQVVALCGRNERLRTRLQARDLPPERLVVQGWTDRIPELIAAADVVLTTAGGMIATETLAVGRPVLFAAPVPGHGRAGAEMMAAAGLALLCPRPSDVTAAIRRLCHDPAELAALGRRAAEFGRRDLDAELAALSDRI
ncbi:galactosyldiacylglycerol synthase [Pseudonocardia sp. K10HN5]|uniref:Galactosyldiacylglycerol synthase n=1 Tax=Pseudonocardia acidicola TaxID=2724939 RepID=A0ABX1S7P5_9PSEU|nr:galactosyldiacylglycerol synthase [Pseudonocardia acidicola]